MSEARLSYDQNENIIFITFPKHTELKTHTQIAAHFERVVVFWRKKAGGKKSYFVVDFDNVIIDIASMEFYTKQTKAAHDECAIASVRYGGDPLQRTVTRLAGMKLQRPSNICQTREQALELVRQLKHAEPRPE